MPRASPPSKGLPPEVSALAPRARAAGGAERPQRGIEGKERGGGRPREWPQTMGTGGLAGGIAGSAIIALWPPLWAFMRYAKGVATPKANTTRRGTARARRALVALPRARARVCECKFVIINLFYGVTLVTGGVTLVTGASPNSASIRPATKLDPAARPYSREGFPKGDCPLWPTTTVRL